ncbi:hypothetical protein [Parvularcula marina]|uniref:Uncharacterized protein n=1 Tax=Parvularcula marina TaxID=2292771 RepID=A0A371RJV8_9PROT|nr:hypothetical protein [Parvularcula marina]RFB05725.1 hypothetical protein DX908_10870 [Parvularcula marina]
MAVVWSLLALLAMAASPVEIVPDEPGIGGQDVPAWTKEAWQADGDALLAVSSFDGSLQLSVGQVPFTTIEADEPDVARVNVATVPHGQLSLIAHTSLEEQAGRIRIELIGDGWQAGSDKARHLLRQNLAHEIAHLAQKQRYDSAYELAVLHEGYAEARALDLLIDAKLWTAADVRLARLGFEQSCEAALRRGPLLPQIEAGDREASYACGALLWIAASERVNARPDVLHRSYAKAVRQPAGLGPWARETFGPDFTRSAYMFLTANYSGGPQTALEGLAAGRL